MSINIVDVLILTVLGVSLVFGLYRGFISGVLSVAALIGSVLFAYAAGGRLAAWLGGNQTLMDTLRYYTDAGLRVGDVNLAAMTVGQISGESAINGVLEGTGLPGVFREAFVRLFSSSAANVTVSELVEQTIVNASLSIISFLICFLVAFVVLSFVIHMISYVFELPVLRHLDALIGGLFGLARGVMLVIIFFSLVPLVLAVVPMEQVSALIESSTLAPLFDSQIILTILRGGL